LVATETSWEVEASRTEAATTETFVGFLGDGNFSYNDLLMEAGMDATGMDMRWGSDLHWEVLPANGLGHDWTSRLRQKG